MLDGAGGAWVSTQEVSITNDQVVLLPPLLPALSTALTLSFLFLMGVEISIPQNTAYALEPVYNSPYSSSAGPSISPEEPGILSKFILKIKNILGIDSSTSEQSDSSIVHAVRVPGEIKSGPIKQMEYNLNEIDRILKDINKSIETGSDVSTHMDDLAFYRSEIEGLDPQVKEEFKRTEDTLRELIKNGTISQKILLRHKQDGARVQKDAPREEGKVPIFRPAAAPLHSSLSHAGCQGTPPPCDRRKPNPQDTNRLQIGGKKYHYWRRQSPFKLQSYHLIISWN